MKICKNCKHISFFDNECLLSAHKYTDNISGKIYTFYNPAEVERGFENKCGNEGKNFEPSKLYILKKFLTR